MLSKWPRLLAVLLCLCLCLQLSLARPPSLDRRQDENTPQPTPEPTGVSQENPTNGGDQEQQPATTTAQETGDKTASASETVVPTTTASPKSGDDVLNETIPEDQLPLTPRLTPAYGVAGFLLMVSGLVYLTIGIKNTWLQIFLSVNLLGNLATTVLIIYVMTVPVSNAIQGAYLVAVVITGAALGGGSTIFKEVTEGLGCILGGFCLSMWILTLVPGGLILQTAYKSVFIAALSLGSFGFFFSHHTRDYALIGLISFGGATASVLGIDCYSRSGLKEFWAYVWDLNEDLFPIGAVTYPITKGMRVESAAIILLCLAGIVSQLKLWRVIQIRRAKKAAEKAEEERNLQEVDETVGRDVEERTARDRRHWERVFGDGDSGAEVGDSTSSISRKSESGDVAEKGSRVMSTSTRPVSPGNSGMDEADNPTSEPPGGMSPEPPSTTPALMTSGEGDGANIMVRVVPDEFPRTPDRESVRDPEEQVWTQNANNDDHPTTERRDSMGVPRAMATSPRPEVVPLPFQVAEDEDYGGIDRQTVGARSSIAGTFADDDERPQSMRSSLARRLSQGSANLLRSLSQRTDKNVSGEVGGSRVELVARRSVAQADDDDEGSLAANVDLESSDDERSTLHGDDGKSVGIPADLPGEVEDAPTAKPEQSEQPEPSAQPQGPQPESDVPEETQSVARSEVPVNGKVSGERGSTVEAPVSGSASSRRAKSTSGTSSIAALTRDALPQPLSRTALKYRTNEWVKHSTTADAPEPDDIQIYDTPEPEMPTKEETPAPLNVDELQQTATTGTPAPAPAPSRPSAAVSNYPPFSPPRSDSRLSMGGSHEPFGRSPRRSSSGILPVQTILEEPTNRTTTRTPAAEDDLSSGRASMSASPFRQTRASSVSPPNGLPYSNSYTLMGQRETYIRNKPLAPYNPLNSGMVDYSLPLHPTPSQSPAPEYVYSSHPQPVVRDDDDMPLSQRRALIRQSSAMFAPRAPSGMGMMAFDPSFNSHQPQRHTSTPAPAIREAQLANFRQSVAADLRSGTPILAGGTRESTMGIGRGGDVKRVIEMQRGAMLREKEAEAQAREAERWEKERREEEFEQMMRSGELMGAHQEAMRRMQGLAREK
ncbi:uncharacterized protein DNG_01414 [Cephalotrichum gorgonifer]|uniref:TM7S3/TM198-like domain-containing protein n=1 Tax=Cephalotrichum gorgonifer TaxID=2041049 RepID=A0AAE8MQX3_9PEZI|nr:uncharacterized protein DNG_01414 [Cephalotrichum gorgonifer]